MGSEWAFGSTVPASRGKSFSTQSKVLSSAICISMEAVGLSAQLKDASSDGGWILRGAGIHKSASLAGTFGARRVPPSLAVQKLTRSQPMQKTPIKRAISTKSSMRPEGHGFVSSSSSTDCVAWRVVATAAMVREVDLKLAYD